VRSKETNQTEKPIQSFLMMDHHFIEHETKFSASFVQLDQPSKDGMGILLKSESKYVPIFNNTDAAEQVLAAFGVCAQQQDWYWCMKRYRGLSSLPKRRLYDWCPKKMT